MMIKNVRNGTRSGENLCVSCRNSMQIKGVTESQDRIMCSYLRGHTVRHPVLECSQYDDLRLPQYEDMMQMAIYISIDKKTGKIGFKTAQEEYEGGMLAGRLQRGGPVFRN